MFTEATFSSRMHFHYIYIGFLWLSLLVGTVSAQTNQQQNLSPEALFRYTHHEWMNGASHQSGLAWNFWTEFATSLVTEFEKVSTKTPSSAAKKQKRRLEIIGAVEEGILTIERFLAEQEQQRQHVPDQAVNPVLADLYVSYGTMLHQLTPMECWKLASDPHTLLIGAPERLDEFQTRLQDDTENQDEIQLIQVLFPPLCFDNADNAVRNAMSLDATNTQAIKLLEKLTGDSDPTLVHHRKPQEFVAELFDSFADTFDSKLVGSLQYRVPQLIGEAVQNIVATHSNAKQGFRAVMDAGCGTGLAGSQLRPFIGSEEQGDGIMVGVDASPKMLDIAARCTRTSGCGTALEPTDDKKKNANEDSRPLYDSLLKMDLEDMTVSNTLNETAGAGVFDLIVAADVLVYFGNLENIMKVFSTLTGNGAAPSWLVFTCERATPEEAPLGFRLMPSGRFAHTKDHVLTQTGKVGYNQVDYQEIVPRMEKGEPVKGHLFVMEANIGPVGTAKNEL